MRTLLLISLLCTACQRPSTPEATPPPPPLPGGPPSERVVATYEPALKDPIIEEMKDENDGWDEARDKETEAIRARQKARDDQNEQDEVSLMAPPPTGAPESTAQFEQVFHFEPQAQYLTGTCWSFAATSFLEAEVQRIAGKKVKLSEIYAVYFEYLEKVRRFVQERGDSYVAQGAEINSVTRMWKAYGAVPQAAYPGVAGKDGRHNHHRLMREIKEFLEQVKRGDLWDEDRVLAHVRIILDAHLGKPPESFVFAGTAYTPSSFLAEVLAINPDDYVQIMSTMKHPFWKQGELEVPDNWWKDATYYNVPLDEFTSAVKTSIQKGFGIGIGGDVSEPGKVYRADLAYIPSFDIPAEYIDQSAREYRIANGATTDDHGVHLVGWAELGGATWYLIKDSGRSSRHGKHLGYYFFREDFVRLKMLTAMVHRDAITDLLARF